MNILVVDYLSPAGHKNFDHIHIKALSDLGHNLHLVGRHNQFGIKDGTCFHETTSIPEWTFTPLPFKPLSGRIMGILRLNWIINHVRTDQYDAIVLLSYDVLSLFPFRFRFKKKVFMINHNNVLQNVNSQFKLKITRLLPQNYIHVVLNELMEKEMCRMLPGKKVVHIPHGLIFNESKTRKPSFLDDCEKFVFCPVNRNFDSSLLHYILSSRLVIDYLETNNIVLYLKKIIEITTESKSIRCLPSFLTTEEYYYMIDNAIAIVLPYGQSFKYRCSGIFFECVARDAKVVATKIPDMEVYRDLAKILFFEDEESFEKCLRQIEFMDENIDKEAFNPKRYWSEVLK